MKQLRYQVKERSNRTRMGTTPVIPILRSVTLVLIGLYIGVNISGLHHQSDSAANTKLPSTKSELNFRTDTQDHHEETASGIREQLKKSQDETKRWQTAVQNLEDKHKSSLEKLKRIESSCETENEKKDDVNFEIVNRHPICQSIMPHPAPSAMALWNQHILKILSASRFPQDAKFMFHDFTAQLLQIISPRLPRSVKTAPFDWRPVENALTIAWERYQYLQLSKEKRDAIPIHDRPRPLKILVMGGSLLVGTNCAMVKKEMGFEFGMPRRECNWSSRVGFFLNAFFLGDVSSAKRKTRRDQKRAEELVQVTKVAMGGTNTATGSVIWQYDLIPEEARNPDIVINAYSTNDMHILTILEAQSTNTTLRDRTFEMIQGFVRQVLGSKHCSKSSDKPIPPLLIHMDDYLGNEQHEIWATTELAQGAQVLANYYGFVSMSYADVIREFVYGDTYEKWFSAEWWIPENTRKGEKSLAFERQIHPGMGMHISSIWVTAYNLLHLASTYCSMPTDVHIQLGSNKIDEYQAGLWGLPDLEMKNKLPKGKPQPRPNGLPPELTKELLLENITSLWRQESDQEESSNGASSSCKVDQDSSNGIPSKARIKCPFAWVSGLSLQQNNVTWVDEYFESQSSTWEGWELSEDGNKIGFIPSKGATNARMILDFAYPQRIQSITIFFMKSYGSKWQNSKLQAKVWSASPAEQQILLEERSLLGTHNKNTSEMYTEEIFLSQPADAGAKLQLEAKLVGGQTFKIMGLAVCS